MAANSLLKPATTVRVHVPASTSNLGPGFDAFGCALKLKNTFIWSVIEKGESPGIILAGPESAGLPEEKSNLAWKAAERLFVESGLPADTMDRLMLRATINIPQARGLGSSSTAIVGGLVGASTLLRKRWTEEQLLELAVEIEGHADNVSAALLGGITVSATGTKPLLCRKYRVHPSVSFVIVVPDYHVKTADARGVLPTMYERTDAVHNLSRTPLILDAMRSGKLHRLHELFDDRLHQPFRRPLYRNYNELAKAALSAGAAAFCVSGAGPSMLAVMPRAKAAKVRARLSRELARLGITGRVLELGPSAQGSRATLRRAV